MVDKRPELMTDIAQRSPPYRSIRDYGVIGNCSSVALVRIDGSVDWCCLPFLDSPSVFAALLDSERGGYFLVQPKTPIRRSSQRYVESTNVLLTEFEVEGGRLAIWDFMPVGEMLFEVDGRPGEPALHRHVRCTDGLVEVQVLWSPRPDYARARPRISSSGDRFIAFGGEEPLSLSGLPEGRVVHLDDGPAVAGRLQLEGGAERVLVTQWGDAPTSLDPAGARNERQRTIDAWRSWVLRSEGNGERQWAGPWRDHVIRSELVLKLMTQPGTGALAAAPTTSLPETLGGERNWDYRFAWIRDAAQVAQAFFAVGHPEHVDAFVRWAEQVASEGEGSQGGGGLVPVLHPLRPQGRVEEVTLGHLEGYRGSSPVRVGNDAAEQLQLDVYGELLNMVFESARLSGHFVREAAPFLSGLANAACGRWQLPDFGIWEMRNGPFHQVYSKVMVWTALHRACWLHERGYLDGNPARWKKAMRQIKREVLRFGYDPELGAFVQRYGKPDLDAANLLIPMMEFLPAEDPRVQGTIDRTLEQLTVRDLVYRYRTDDGLPGEEGAFVLCSFWLVDALALSARLEEANRVFESVLARVNHLGLLSEQIDPYSGEFLGNFPQAYSHLGIINSSLYLAAKEGRDLPISPLLGDRADGSRNSDVM